MKHVFSGMMIALALVLAIVMGVAALAETTETEPTLPPAEAPATPAPAEDSTSASTDSTALRDALNAYNSARQSSCIDNLEAELNGYVASGKLTQEQADLILNYYKEQQSLRNGTCPNCGYQFQNGYGYGKGGRMNGGKGGKGGRGGFSGMRGYGQIPGGQGNAQGNAQDDAQANGTAYEDSWTNMAGFAGYEGI